MPGPRRAHQRLIEREFCHQVDIPRPPTPGWPALNCHAIWLAIRCIGRNSQDHHRCWAKQIFPTEISTYGFREATEAEAFRRFVTMIAPLDEAMLYCLREVLSSAHAPHATPHHSTGPGMAKWDAG